MFKTLSTQIISANCIRWRESLPTSSLRVCVFVCVWWPAFLLSLSEISCHPFMFAYSFIFYICVCVIKVLSTCARSQLCVVRCVWEGDGVRAVRISLHTSWLNVEVVNRSSGDHVEPPQSPQQESVPQLQARQPDPSCHRTSRLRGPHQDLYQAMELHAGQTLDLFIFHMFVFFFSLSTWQDFVFQIWEWKSKIWINVNFNKSKIHSLINNNKEGFSQNSSCSPATNN